MFKQKRKQLPLLVNEPLLIILNALNFRSSVTIYFVSFPRRYERKIFRFINLLYF